MFFFLYKVLELFNIRLLMCVDSYFSIKVY